MSLLVLKVNHVSSVEQIWRSLRAITNIHINTDPCIHEEVREKLSVPGSNDAHKCYASF